MGWRRWNGYYLQAIVWTIFEYPDSGRGSWSQNLWNQITDEKTSWELAQAELPQALVTNYDLYQCSLMTIWDNPTGRPVARMAFWNWPALHQEGQACVLLHLSVTGCGLCQEGEWPWQDSIASSCEASPSLNEIWEVHHSDPYVRWSLLSLGSGICPLIALPLQA